MPELIASDIRKDQYVIFSLAAEQYGVAATVVREIICLPPITRVPHLPNFFMGVINLRGTILPVLDLKLKFGMPTDAYHAKTCVIIIELKDKLIGMIVDAVIDVVDFLPEEIDTAHAFGSEINAEYIAGLAKLADKLVILLDAAQILKHNDIVLLHNQASALAANE